MKFGLIKLYWNFETKADNPKVTKTTNILNEERLLHCYLLNNLVLLYLFILSDITMIFILR